MTDRSLGAGATGGHDAGDASVAGVILAGSYAWSSRSFDELAPRPLMPVAQTPLACHVLGWFRGAGVRRAVLCANGMSAAVCQTIRATARLEMRVEPCEDPLPRGTAGCARDACAHVGEADTVVVADGSVIPTIDFSSLLEHHRCSKADVTVVVQRDSRPAGHPDLRPVGIYVFGRHVLDVVPDHGFCDIKENLIPRLHKKGGRVVPFVAAECCPRVFDAASYLSVNQWLIPRVLRCAAALAGDGYRVSGLTALHRTASVDAGATILGPVLLGPDVVVEAGATVIGPTALGAETIVETGALLARSVAWQRCLVARGAFVDRSVLTDDAVTAPGEEVFGAIRVASRWRPPAGPIPTLTTPRTSLTASSL